MEKESYDQRIKKLERALKDARDDRAQAQARFDVLQKDLENINHRIAEMGFKPEELLPGIEVMDVYAYLDDAANAGIQLFI